MSFALLGDKLLEEGTSTLKPHFSAFDLSTPFTVSGDLNMSKPAFNTISNWFHVETEPDPDKRKKMEALLGD